MAVNASSMGVVATTSSLVDLFFNSPATQTVIVSLLANSGKDLVAGGVPAIQALLQTGAATDMASALGRPAAFIPAAVATEGLVMLTCVSLGDPGLGVVLVIFLSLPAYLLFKMLALGQPDAPPQQPVQPVAGGNVRRARHEPYEVWLGRHVKHWIITVLALAGAFVLAFVLVALADVALQFHRAPSGQEMGRAAIRANGRPPHSASLGVEPLGQQPLGVEPLGVEPLARSHEVWSHPRHSEGARSAQQQPPAVRGQCCHDSMVAGSPSHTDLAARHVVNQLLELTGAGVPHALAALERATDADGVAGHAREELLALMQAVAPSLPVSELEWCVAGCV